MATAPAKPTNQDDLFEDKQLRKARDKTLEHMKWGPMITGVSRFLMAIGAPILTAGVLALIGVGGATAGAAALPIAIAGACVTALGIATEYMGTRMWQSASLDQTEVSAQCNARHLVQELKSSHVSMTFEQNKRNDGRSWVQATGRGNGELQQQF